MREHLYRGQRRDTKEWVYGSYHYCTEHGTIRNFHYESGNRVIVDNPVQFNSHWILVHSTPDSSGWGVRDTFRAYDVIPETVSQYIGLKDSKGNKIFEKDILNGPFRTGSFGKSIRTKMFNFLVRFHINTCGTVNYTDMPKDYGNFRFCPYLTECTIVGNLANNPELLQNK